MLKRAHRGFTLIELMFGLVLVAVLFMFAMPNYRLFIENQKLRARAESISSGLQIARQEAIRLNTNVTFMLTSTVPTEANVGTAVASTSGPHWLVRGSVMDPATNTSAVTLLDSQVADEVGGNTPSLVSANVAQVVFTPFGTTSGGSSQTISITPANGQCVADGGNLRCLRVQVSNSGQIRMCDPAVDTVGDTRRC